ncbi:hypothetical protein AGABI2DRAFT_121811 [Agaricus bisporus var. bisporus H97]|uniref:hypothetical protein n=1 Tax=Agaricus bisporus var. bisporus (strain H97 / ATCC MYA-4626 / FGSC 10389) TaxID=936046 RepID=UPI00029F6791|nr:hypothetical protein AGABI2DRAFT_121811 [Agaricus bisporus var. bisporus H97]EKV43674.1 hypothetical protein AGABI2DRAFT_121811 [Agaricus bisporus var. bisporus H97]
MRGGCGDGIGEEGGQRGKSQGCGGPVERFFMGGDLQASMTLDYDLVVRQEPKQARMCGVGGKADRRPIDPPPIVQLRVIDRALSSAHISPPASPPPSHYPDGPPPDPAAYAQSYLQNPYYFMFASLAKPDDDAELHWLKDGRTRCTTGSVVSSLYHLKDPQHHNEDAGFFVFPDLSVRTEGSYRLKLSLFEVVGYVSDPPFSRFVSASFLIQFQ